MSSPIQILQGQPISDKYGNDPCVFLKLKPLNLNPRVLQSSTFESYGVPPKVEATKQNPTDNKEQTNEIFCFAETEGNEIYLSVDHFCSNIT